MIILFTDGMFSDDYQDPLVREVKDKGYQIFSIGLNVKNGSIQEKRLSDMAEGTGGRYMPVVFEGEQGRVLSKMIPLLVNEIARSLALMRPNIGPANIDLVAVTQPS